METSGQGKDKKEPRSRGRPRDPERIERMLAAARDHFFTSGFDKASMDRIAASAGVSKVTLYSHFPSKEALFNAIVNEPIRHTFELDVENLVAARPQEALLHIALVYLELITSAEVLEHVRMLSARVAHHPSLGQAFFETGPEAVVDGLVKFLRRACLQGALALPNVQQAAEQFLAMVRGNEQIRLLMGQNRLRESAARKRYCRSCVDLFVKGYAGPACV